MVGEIRNHLKIFQFQTTSVAIPVFISKFTRCTWMHQESLFKLRHRETAEDRKQRALYYRTIKSFYPPALQVAFRDLLFNFGSCWCIIKGGWRRISHTHCLLLGANLTPAYPEHKAADWAGSIPVCTNRPFLPTELSATLSYFFTKNTFWCNELVTFDIRQNRLHWKSLQKHSLLTFSRLPFQ